MAMKFKSAEDRAKFNSYDAIIKMMRKLAAKEDEEMGDVEEVQDQQREVLDDADPEAEDMEKEEGLSDLAEEEGLSEDEDEFEKEKREYMQRDPKIGKPVPGNAHMIFMMGQGPDPKKSKDFKGKKGF